MKNSNVLLCILDGWGVAEPSKNNAVALAKKPNYDRILNYNPHCFLSASGEAVGLPAGQMGNSEVGHMNIGAGRIVEQILRQIDRQIIEQNPTDIPLWQQTLKQLSVTKGKLHLFGLISNGRVHGCHRQLIALAKSAIEQNIEVCIHGIGDGRDSAPQGLPDYLQQVISAVPEARLSTLIGRYYALDRDNRWDRIEKAWQLLMHGKGAKAQNWQEALNNCYQNQITDEFLPGMVLDPDYTGFATNDILMCCNYRTDRIRQIVQALQDPNFNIFARTGPSPLAHVLSMVAYGSEFTQPLFNRENIQETLGETIAKAGLRQVRIAETEKFPHVTYFFNGGRETASENEEHCLIPSPKVASYDLAPEMSASGVTEQVLKAIESQADMIIVNFANPDMVGHTGDLQATIKAVEAVDYALGKIVENIQNYTLLVTADHGNAETLWDDENNMPHTAHTTNPVRMIAIGGEIKELSDGVLGDIAPTMLKILGIAQPFAMTGNSLIRKS